MKPSRLWIIAAVLTAAAWVPWRVYAGKKPALPAQAPALQGQTVSRDFDVRLFAPYLEPGIGGQNWEPGDEMLAPGGVEWTDAARTQGRLRLRMWYHKAWAEFQTTADRRKVAALNVQLGWDGEADRMMLLWRHHHGYALRPGAGYFWKTIGDEDLPMPQDLGARYDRALTGVWEMWARRRAQSLLESDEMSPVEGAGSFALAGHEIPEAYQRLKQKTPLRYGPGGLAGGHPLVFYVRIWHIPVKVQLLVVPVQPTHHNPWIIGLGSAEWRRRHGYKKKFWGGYQWDADFPSPRPDIESFGAEMDRLMEHEALFWADVSTSLILNNLDADLKKAMSELQAAPSIAAQTPALKQLDDAVEKGLNP